MGGAVKRHRQYEQNKHFPTETFHANTCFTQQGISHSKYKNAAVHRHHSIRPGHFPAQFCGANKLASHQLVADFRQRAPPGLGNFRLRITKMGAKQKPGAFRQLVAEEVVNKIFKFLKLGEAGRDFFKKVTTIPSFSSFFKKERSGIYKSKHFQEFFGDEERRLVNGLMYKKLMSKSPVIKVLCACAGIFVNPNHLFYFCKFLRQSLFFSYIFK